VKLWRVSDGQLIRSFQGHSCGVNSANFSPDGTMVVSASSDGTVKLWRVSDGQLIKSFEGYSSWVNSANFSPDGTMVVSAFHDNTVKLWQLSNIPCLKASAPRSIDGRLKTWWTKKRNLIVAVGAVILIIFTIMPLVRSQEPSESNNANTVEVATNQDKQEEAVNYLDKGYEYDNAKEYKKAIQSYKKAIQVAPGFAPAYFNLAFTYKELGDYELAIQNFTKFMEIFGDDPFAYNDRGFCYSRLRKYKKAVADYDQAISLDKDYA
jgi:hypothetical protein